MTTLGANRKNKKGLSSIASAKEGFTMMELMVSIAIFCIVILIILQAFIKVINYNRIAVQNQSLQDHTEFIFQLMSREIRMAKINDTDQKCGVGGNQIYATSTIGVNYQLKFINANDECVVYSRITDESGIGRIQVTRAGQSAPITPQDINVEAFNVSATDFVKNVTDRRHPATVHYYIRLNSKIWDPPIMEFTNFITARNSEQF